MKNTQNFNKNPNSYELEEIKSGNVDITSIIDEDLNNALMATEKELSFIDINDLLIPSVNKLVHSQIPKSEFKDHAPKFLLNENTFAYVLLKRDNVIGYVCASFDDEALILHSLIISQKFKGQKLGTLLLLSLIQIAESLEAKSISCISTEQGKFLYKSLGFTSMAENSFEAKLPMDNNLLEEKLRHIIFNPPSPSPKRLRFLQNEPRSDTEKNNSAVMNQHVLKR